MSDILYPMRIFDFLFKIIIGFRLRRRNAVQKISGFDFFTVIRFAIQHILTRLKRKNRITVISQNIFKLICFRRTESIFRRIAVLNEKKHGHKHSFLINHIYYATAFIGNLYRYGVQRHRTVVYYKNTFFCEPKKSPRKNISFKYAYVSLSSPNKFSKSR